MKSMDPALEQFLNKKSPAAVENTVWGDGRFPLRVQFFLSASMPPQAFISSVRAVLLRGDEVMVVYDGVTPFHVIPGGRREKGETLMETLRRELLEETGWSFVTPRLIGFIHYQHLAPRPDNYAYPFPDFLQVVYAAQAGEYHPEHHVKDAYELQTGFRPLPDARELMGGGQLLFLETAVAGRNI